MSKLTCVVASPVDTFSGYGTMARSFAKSLLKLKRDEWDIQFLSLRWGSTPFGALNKENAEELDIINKIIADGQLKFRPDIWIQISVSEEFQPIGTVNIGYSCLVETSILPGEMLEGLNKMNFNLLSCNHAKSIAESTSWEKLDQNKNKIGNLTLEKPCEVLFIGLDTSVFKKPESVSFDLSFIKESFCFLSVGHFLPGTQNLEDRKMLGRLIKTFLETFKDKKNKPALILKSSTAGYSYVDKERCLAIINNIKNQVQGKDLPNVYLIHGELTEQELCELYAHEKVKAFALVGNEGYGLPYIEFSAVSGKPVITSPWSGHIDFLDKEFNVFVNGTLEKVHPSVANKYLISEADWFKPNEKDLSNKLEDVYKNYSKYVDNGKRQGYKSRTEFSIDKMAESLDSILKKHMPVISKPVPLSLPKLAEIKKPKLDYLEDIKQ
jgi:glycosyltransferase involved in cell wall biosynthesis